jgi:tRNA(fMet)-specific endonuclease VapC
MAGRLILDTNIVIGLINHNGEIDDCIRGYLDIYVPSIVLGELYFGAFRSKKIDFNLEKIDQFIRDASILFVDRTTSLYYGRVKQQLFSNGRPIPDNDIWIAAIALQNNADIATLDRHFDAVENLTVIGPQS